MLKQIVFLLLFFVSAVYAAEVDYLYQAEVSVADQGQQERNRAIAEGFQLMLVKVTGNRNIGHNQSLAETFRKASRYVQQYRYRVEADESDAAVERRYLRITFDKQAVDRTLRENGLPVWGKSRPRVIVWTGFEESGRRKLLMPEFDQQIIAMFNRAADLRGIPLLFPVMDLQDQSAISASDLWGAFEGAVSNASERYQADAILLVRIKSGSDGFSGSSWLFIGGDDSRQWEFRGQELGNLIVQGVNAISDHLAGIYAPAGGGDAQSVNMQVSGLDTFAQLLSVESFLDSQETVQAYQLRQNQADKAIFALSLRDGMQAFIQAVELSGLFEPQDMMFSAPIPTVVEVVEPVSSQPVEQTPEDANPDGTSATVQDPVSETTVPEIARDPLSDIQLYYRLR
jgi:hypothetical protein